MTTELSPADRRRVAAWHRQRSTVAGVKKRGSALATDVMEDGALWSALRRSIIMAIAEASDGTNAHLMANLVDIQACEEELALRGIQLQFRISE